MFTARLPNAPRVALVGCSAAKLKHAAPARELYTSGMFRAALAYAERTCDALLIVSAYHGVIAPNTVIGPYNRNLRLACKAERVVWGGRTIETLLPAFKVPPLLVILAGQLYADALACGAYQHDLPQPEEPLRGIAGFGPRIAWLKTNTPARSAAA
jgi:hypothetical protein